MAEKETATLSKTEAFKIALQDVVLEVTGKKVSRQAAWDLFKKFSKLPFETILKTYNEAGKPAITYGAKMPELVLPLAGIGSYRIITVGGEDNCTVKPRFYISSSIENAIKEALGFKADAEEASEATEAADEFDL